MFRFGTYLFCASRACVGWHPVGVAARRTALGSGQATRNLPVPIAGMLVSLSMRRFAQCAGFAAQVRRINSLLRERRSSARGEEWLFHLFSGLPYSCRWQLFSSICTCISDFELTRNTRPRRYVGLRDRRAPSTWFTNYSSLRMQFVSDCPSAAECDRR